MNNIELRYKVLKIGAVIIAFIACVILGYVICNAYETGSIRAESMSEKRKSISEGESYSISVDDSELSQISLRALSLSDREASRKYKVDINTADIERFMLLPGIGEARSESIIKMRYEIGGFVCIEDLRNVSGIGEALFDKIDDRIYASEISEEVKERILRDAKLVEQIEYEERLKALEK